MSDLEQRALDLLFMDARSQNGWRDQDVSDDQLRAAYDIARFGPTSMNTQPMRLVFLRSAESKERLRPALAPANVEKVMTAPVVAIIAFDLGFAEQLPKNFPHNPNAKAIFEGNDELIVETAFRNSTLQAAYFMLALRAGGLDVGPMSGFNRALVDQEFFSGSSWQSNFLCGIGYGDPAKVFPRLPRLDFEDACSVL